MNELQQRLWGRMIAEIDSFLDKNGSLNKLVNNLEGLFSAGEFKDEKLKKDWYEKWGELEIINAIALDKNKKVEFDKAKPFLEEMKKYLISLQ